MQESALRRILWSIKIKRTQSHSQTHHYFINSFCFARAVSIIFHALQFQFQVIHYVEVIIGYHIEIAEQGLRTHCSEGKRRVWQFGHNNLSLDTEEEMGGAKSDAENGLSNKTNFRVARNYSPSVTKE